MGRLAEAQRKLLEQMMGPESMGIQTVQLTLTDEKVCKNYLCGTCPHVVFQNTKMDLGPCSHTHSEKLQIEFQMLKLEQPSSPVVQRIEGAWHSHLFGFVDDCDRRISAAHRRLEKTPEENAKTTALMREIGEIEISIQDGTAEIEQLGEAGKVDESIQKLAAVEALKLEKSEKERELQTLTDTSGASGHQKLRVCETCGAYLSILDSDRRLADHFGGKMHLGYKELRDLLVTINEERQQRRLNPPPAAAPPPSAPAAPAAAAPPPPPPSGPSGGGGGGYGGSSSSYDRDSRGGYGGDRGGGDRYGSSSRGSYDDRDRRGPSSYGGSGGGAYPPSGGRGYDRDRSRSPPRGGGGGSVRY